MYGFVKFRPKSFSIFILVMGWLSHARYRIAFPFDLKLCNTTDDAEHVDVPYQLFAVVVHVGSGPNHGHYVSAVKAHGRWIFFDDESVDSIGERTLYSFFGSSIVEKCAIACVFAAFELSGALVSLLS